MEASAFRALSPHISPLLSIPQNSPAYFPSKDASMRPSAMEVSAYRLPSSIRALKVPICLHFNVFACCLIISFRSLSTAPCSPVIALLSPVPSFTKKSSLSSQVSSNKIYVHKLCLLSVYFYPSMVNQRSDKRTRE